MQWSKLKQRIEQRFAECFQSRLEVFETRYRMGHNHQQGEIWLALDREKIFSTSDFLGWQRIQHLKAEGRTFAEAFDETAAQGTLPVDQSNTLLFDTLNMSVEEMLTSSAVLVRGLGIADARCGKRRLRSLEVSMEAEHSFVRQLFYERAPVRRPSQV